MLQAPPGCRDSHPVGKNETATLLQKGFGGGIGAVCEVTQASACVVLGWIGLGRGSQRHTG